MGTIGQDLRYGLRLLARKPGFAATAILTLALGIGANTAMFSVIDAVLVRSLPYPQPDRLFRVWTADTGGEWSRGGTSLANFADWRAQSDGFAEMAVYNEIGGSLTGDGSGRAEHVRSALVTPGFFATLGVAPAPGRGFRAEENQPGRDGVAVIGHDLWQRRYGGDPAIVGRTVSFAGRPLEIVGVMPPGFAFPSPDVQLWKPFGLAPGDGETREAHWVYAIGRLAPGVERDAAQAEMTAIAAGLERAYPEANADDGVALEPLHEATVSGVRPALLILWGAVGCVLLIACANLANLLLARATVRSQELAVRSALGAGRARLLRQLLTESALLAVVGSSVGVGLAGLAVQTLPLLAALGFHGAARPAIDARVLAFSAGLAFVTAFAFGAFPALRMTGRASMAGLRGRQSTSAGEGRARDVLIAAEVAVALVLTVGAGLLVRSVGNVLSVDPGFETDGLITLRIEPPMLAEMNTGTIEDQMASFAADRARAAGFFARVADRVEALPGVRSVAAVNRVPLTGDMWGTGIVVEGGSTASEDQLPVLARVVTPGYFDTMGIPLRAGRTFDARDAGERRPVTVISATMAEALFPDDDPLGRRVSFNPDDDRFWYTVIGVVGEVNHAGLTQPQRPTFYTNMQQSWFGFFGNWGMDVVVSTSAPPATLMTSVRDVVTGLDPTLPAVGVRTMQQVMGDDSARQRWMALLLGTFSTVALILAAVGVYGVMAYSVSRRTQEFGIRMAIGARRVDVLTLVLRQGLGVVAAGIVVGLLGTFALTRYLESLLFRTAPTDPTTWIAVCAVLLTTATLAAWIPAHRATRINPQAALKGPD